MTNSLHKEEIFSDGSFKSVSLRDSVGDKLTIATKSPEFSECAEKIVEALNDCTQAEATE